MVGSEQEITEAKYLGKYSNLWSRCFELPHAALLYTIIYFMAANTKCLPTNVYFIWPSRRFEGLLTSTPSTHFFLWRERIIEGNSIFTLHRMEAIFLIQNFQIVIPLAFRRYVRL